MPDQMGGSNAISKTDTVSNISNVKKMVGRLYQKDRKTLMFVFVPILITFLLSVTSFIVVMSMYRHQKIDNKIQNDQKKMLSIRV
jgi:hypothetical protein